MDWTRRILNFKTDNPDLTAFKVDFFHCFFPWRNSYFELFGYKYLNSYASDGFPLKQYRREVNNKEKEYKKKKYKNQSWRKTSKMEGRKRKK